MSKQNNLAILKNSRKKVNEERKFLLGIVKEEVKSLTTKDHTFIHFDETVTLDMVGQSSTELYRIFRDGGLVIHSPNGSIESMKLNDLNVVQLLDVLERIIEEHSTF